MIILDTNVLSELRKLGDNRADPNVTAWIEDHDAASLFLGALTIMEVEIGVLRAVRRDHTQGALLRAWMDRYVMPEFHDRILPVDTQVALRCACLHVPDPHSDRDALIAATALVHGMAVATRNTSDFVATGVTLLNPWTSA